MRARIRHAVRDWFVVHNGQLHLLALAAICLAIQGIYLAAVPPATGFETSIYEPYPITFWLAFYLCIALVVVVLFASAISSRTFYGRALTILAVNYGFLLFLPTFRGYQLHDRGTGDLLVHLGHVRGIIETGNVPSLWYPFEHVLMAVFGVFGVPLEESNILFTLVFLILFISTTGIFMRSLVRLTFALAAGTACAVPILFTSAITSAQPAIFSVLLFPALMTFTDRYRRTIDKRYFVLLCLVSFAILFFHPMTSLFMILLLVTNTVSGYVYGRLSRDFIYTTSGAVAGAMIPMVFTWYANFGQTWFMLNRIIERLLGGAPSAIESSGADAAILTVSQTLIRFVQLYGAIFIYLLIGTAVIAFIAYRTYRSRHTYIELHLTAQFGIGFVILVLLMQFHISMSPIRNSRYIIVMAIFVVAFAIIWAILSAGRGRAAITIGLTIAVIITTILAAGGVYQPNNHLTKSEFAGVDYAIEHHDESTDVYSFDIQNNMEQYVRSTQSPDIRPTTFDTRENEIPYRLGYVGNESAADTYGNAYLVTKEFDTEFYTASYYFPQQKEALFVYDESDKERLRNDPSVDRLYDNGGFEGWRVNA